MGNDADLTIMRLLVTAGMFGKVRHKYYVMYVQYKGTECAEKERVSVMGMKVLDVMRETGLYNIKKVIVILQSLGVHEVLQRVVQTKSMMCKMELRYSTYSLLTIRNVHTYINRNIAYSEQYSMPFLLYTNNPIKPCITWTIRMHKKIKCATFVMLFTRDDRFKSRTRER